MAIDLDNSYVEEYIKNLKETKYVHPDTKTAVTQAVNYGKVIDVTVPTINKNKNGTNRLLTYYVARYNQVTKIITQIESSLLDNNIEVEYDTFNEYTITYTDISPDMNAVAGLINYTLDSTISKLRNLRREQKILSTTLAKLSNIVLEYDTMETTLNTLKAKLV